MKVRVNEKSISAKLEKVKHLADEKSKERLENIAWYIVVESPVKSGAYVLSHSVVPSGFGGGRLRKSDPDRIVDEWTTKNEAMAQLKADIEALDLENTSGALFRNRAVHAPTVEEGWYSRTTGQQVHEGYYIYTNAKDKFGRGEFG